MRMNIFIQKCDIHNKIYQKDHEPLLKGREHNDVWRVR